VARLEQSGVIRGYTVVVEPALVGRPLGFVVGLQIAQGTPLDGILDELVAIPEIDEVMVVTGRWDLLVNGRVADAAQLNDLLTKGLWQSPSFRHSETMVVIDDRRTASASPQTW
jgi:DNA-binding Lrp family transcriptional regulator